MAELADALDSGSSRSNPVEVQVLLPARMASVFVVFEITVRTLVFYIAPWHGA